MSAKHMFPQKCLTCPQKSPTCPQKSPTCRQKSPTCRQKSPIFPLKSRISLHKNNIHPHNDKCYRWAPVCWRSRTHQSESEKELYISAQEPYISVQEPYMSAKEPYISAKEPYISAQEPSAITQHQFVGAAEPVKMSPTTPTHTHTQHSYTQHTLSLSLSVFSLSLPLSFFLSLSVFSLFLSLSLSLSFSISQQNLLKWAQPTRTYIHSNPAGSTKPKNLPVSPPFVFVEMTPPLFEYTWIINISKYLVQKYSSDIFRNSLWIFLKIQEFEIILEYFVILKIRGIFFWLQTSVKTGKLTQACVKILLKHPFQFLQTHILCHMYRSFRCI